MESEPLVVPDGLAELRAELLELQETSRTYEAELEAEVDSLAARNEQLLAMNKALQDENAHLKSSLQSKVQLLQQENLRCSAEVSRLSVENERLLRLLRESETQVEWTLSKLREKDFEVQELTGHYEATLEELALATDEVESLNAALAEQTRQFQQRTKELTCQIEATTKLHPQITVFVNSQPKRSPPSQLSRSIVGQNSLGMVDTLIESLQARAKQK